MHAIFMRSQVDGVSLTGAKILLPGENTTNILTQVLITNGGKVCSAELTPAHPLKHDVITVIPGAGDDGCAIRQLSKNQPMH